MAFDGNGNYNPPAPEYPLQPQTVISSADMNTLIQDIANALGNCMTRDSQGSPSVDLNLFTKKIINLGAAVNPNDAMRKVDVETYAITATTDRDMAGFRLKNLPASPTAGTDAVSANYVNTAQADRTMGGHHLTGAPAAPYSAYEYVPKQYVDDQDALKASLAGANYTGTHDFTGGTALVTTQAPTDSTTKAASTAFVQSVAMNASLPGLVGNALKYLRVDVAETTAEWARVDAYGGRSARTSNTVLAAGDIGKLIDITSGTFTQTFTAAATLGGNWFCHIRNAGAGDITLDPNGSELIDGLTSYVMYPGETRLVTCNGTGFHTIVMTSFARTFTFTETFTMPPGYNRVQGLIWGGGGGGDAGYGGNGGSCAPLDLRAAVLWGNYTATVGGGGAAGADGGASSIFGISSGTASKGTSLGGQGGTFPYGRSNLTGPIPPDRINGAINYAAPIYADYGGGAGTNGAGNLLSLTHSIYGGGGGVASGVVGSSVFAGAGGSGAGNGVAPAGGGGPTGGGARGEIQIWGVL